ncbi:MAG: hypothetical protein IJ781_06100 [Atopobiaceae bacterium]|nr:hypothetical protein [Atopobiaceae bacterium]
MDEHEFEEMLGQVLGQDLSIGTEAFRDTLLERCLDELEADEEGVALDDADLDMLAAAGDLFASDQDDPFKTNW